MNRPPIHPETKEAMKLVAFIVCCFIFALGLLVTIIAFFMSYGYD